MSRSEWHQELHDNVVELKGLDPEKDIWMVQLVRVEKMLDMFVEMAEYYADGNEWRQVFIQEDSPMLKDKFGSKARTCLEKYRRGEPEPKPGRGE
jgi:hypothetical protein